MFKLNNKFSSFATYISNISGKASASILAFIVVIVWVITGPFFSFSDTWQLVINTGTTIVTFLMVFIIQNTQNRDGEAVQIKLDEIIRALKSADNVELDIEDLSQEQLDTIKKKYKMLAKKERKIKK